MVLNDLVALALFWAAIIALIDLLPGFVRERKNKQPHGRTPLRRSSVSR